MMINYNYSEIITQARDNGLRQIDFKNSTDIAHTTPSLQDKLTLSAQAQAKLKGAVDVFQEQSPVYEKPKTAAQLLAENKHNQAIYQPRASAVGNNDLKVLSSNDSRFQEMMQSILDKRLGVDRKKLEELDAMMEEIAKNENLSPEQKAKAIAEIEKMREDVIVESIEVKKIVKKNDINTENTN